MEEGHRPETFHLLLHKMGGGQLSLEGGGIPCTFLKRVALIDRGSACKNFVILLKYVPAQLNQLNARISNEMHMNVLEQNPLLTDVNMQ